MPRYEVRHASEGAASIDGDPLAPAPLQSVHGLYWTNFGDTPANGTGPARRQGTTASPPATSCWRSPRTAPATPHCHRGDGR
jgi:hypothetical protein